MPRKIVKKEWLVEENDEGAPQCVNPYGQYQGAVPSFTFAAMQIGECKPVEGEEIDKITFIRWCDILESGMAVARIKVEVTKLNYWTFWTTPSLKMVQTYLYSRTRMQCTVFANTSVRATTHCCNAKNYERCRKDETNRS